MRTMAKATYTALTEAGASDETAREAAAETGEIFVNLEATKARLNVLIGIVVAGFALVIGFLFQIALRLGEAVRVLAATGGTAGGS